MIERADERLVKLSGKGTNPRFGSKPSSFALREAAAMASSVKVVQIDHIRVRKSSFAPAPSVVLIAILRKQRERTLLYTVKSRQCASRNYPAFAGTERP